MVDPSCSGSGIVNRMDKLVDEAQGTSEKKVTTPNKIYYISQLASTRDVIGKLGGRISLYDPLNLNVSFPARPVNLRHIIISY